MQQHTDTYSTHFAAEMFFKYINFWQHRNELIRAKRASWQSAVFWLRQVNFYGRILVSRDIITTAEFRRAKFPQQVAVRSALVHA